MMRRSRPLPRSPALALRARQTGANRSANVSEREPRMSASAQRERDVRREGASVSVGTHFALLGYDTGSAQLRANVGSIPQDVAASERRRLNWVIAKVIAILERRENAAFR